MRKTEVFITFYLLQDKTNLSKNIRQMAADLGLSIGSVHNALQHLQEEGFLIEDKDKRILRKRAQLFDRDRTVIGRHIRNIFSVSRKLRDNLKKSAEAGFFLWHFRGDINFLPRKLAYVRIFYQYAEGHLLQKWKTLRT